MVGYGPFFDGWPWLGLASFVIFWGLVAVGVVFLIRYLNRRGSQPGGPFWQAGRPPYPPPYPPPGVAAAEHILAERFARGEIDEQEYRDRLATLRNAGAYPGPPGPAPHGPAAQGPPPAGAAPAEPGFPAPPAGGAG